MLQKIITKTTHTHAKESHPIRASVFYHQQKIHCNKHKIVSENKSREEENEKERVK